MLLLLIMMVHVHRTRREREMRKQTKRTAQRLGTCQCMPTVSGIITAVQFTLVEVHFVWHFSHRKNVCKILPLHIHKL